jgi:hypothetical protein
MFSHDEPLISCGVAFFLPWKGGHFFNLIISSILSFYRSRLPFFLKSTLLHYFVLAFAFSVFSSDVYSQPLPHANVSQPRPLDLKKRLVVVSDS